MKKGVIIGLGLGLAILFVVIAVKRVKYVDWTPSFNEKSNTPYGVSVLYKELPNIFNNAKLKTVYHMPEAYLSAHSAKGKGDHQASGSFIIIGNSDYLTQLSAEVLLEFVAKGNTLFISDFNLSPHITDQLHIEVAHKTNEIDSLSQLNLTNPKLKHNNTRIDKIKDNHYFVAINTQKNKVLGHVEVNGKAYPNFIKQSFGLGNVYVHLQPKIFTNYNLLKDKRYTYVEAVLSYIDNEKNIYFDSFSKIQTTEGGYGNAKQESDLSWFLNQNSFKWAWYILLWLALLFVVFNAKRRQRIVTVIKPLQNKSIAFVQTISQLYQVSGDYKSMFDKKSMYFLEKIRTGYNIDTSVLDENFVKQLASKSGRTVAVVSQVIDYINYSKKKHTQFTQQNVLTLNKYIETFYSKSNGSR